DRMDVAADVLDEVEPLRAVRFVFAGDHDLRDRRAVDGLVIDRRGAHDTVEAAYGIDDLIGVLGVRHDPDRLRFPGWEMVGQDLEALRRFGLDTELLGLVESDRGPDEAGGHDTEDDDSRTEVQPRCPDHAGGDCPPDRGLRRGGPALGARRTVTDSVFDLGYEGPEHLLAADREHGWQGDEHRGGGDDEADGGGDAESAGAGDDGEDEAEQGQDDGEVGGEDRRRGMG